MQGTETLQYPVGKFQRPTQVATAQIDEYIAQIEALPGQLKAALERLRPEQHETPYRPGGWNVRQVIHHIPDSHLNSYVRFKLALTEERPTIKPYDQAKWAELADTNTTPVTTSMAMLTALHDRWARLMRSLTPEQWKREYNHPEMGLMTLGQTAALYAWHSRHHLGHVKIVSGS